MALSRPAKSLILASGTFLTTCMNLVLAAILARLFSVHEYGTYRQALLVYAFLSPLIMLGLPHALYFFLPGEERAARRILAENLILLFLTGGLFTAFLAFGGHRLIAGQFENPQLSSALLIFSLYPLFAIPLSALGPCLMARDRPKQVAVFTLISRLLTLAVVLIATLVFRSINAALFGMVLGTGLTLIGALWLMTAACPAADWRPTRKGLWTVLKFSVPLGLASMLGSIGYYLGQVMVAYMCTAEEFAVYANGAIEIPLIGVITGSVIAVITPDLSRQLKADDRAAALGLWKSATVKSMALLIPIMGLLFVAAPDAIRVLFSAKYDASTLPFRLLLLLIPIRATNFGAMFLAANRNDIVLYRSVGDLLLIAAATFICVPWLGAWGAALATVIVIYGYTIPFCLVAIARMMKVRVIDTFPFGRCAVILSATLMAAVPTWMLLSVLGSHSAMLRLLAGTLVYGIAITGAFLLLGIREAFEVLHSVLPQALRQSVTSRVPFVGKYFDERPEDV